MTGSSSAKPETAAWAATRDTTGRFSRWPPTASLEGRWAHAGHPPNPGAVWEQGLPWRALERRLLSTVNPTQPESPGECRQSWGAHWRDRQSPATLGDPGHYFLRLSKATKSPPGSTLTSPSVQVFPGCFPNSWVKLLSACAGLWPGEEPWLAPAQPRGCEIPSATRCRKAYLVHVDKEEDEQNQLC